MAFNLGEWWPRAEVARLKTENRYLTAALRNATDKAADSLTRLEEVRALPCPACVVLKQTVNFHVIAAGSKVGMFDGVGPTLPPPQPRVAGDDAPSPAPMRASKAVKRQRQDFLDEFFKTERNQFAAEEVLTD